MEHFGSAAGGGGEQGLESVVAIRGGLGGEGGHTGDDADAGTGQSFHKVVVTSRKCIHNWWWSRW